MTPKENSYEKNKRIAKNTLLLYVRMLFMMAVNLYTSRVVLNALGVEDFGIYNVVGGVVSMFSMLSGSLSAAVTRFITYELGTGNRERLKKTFSSSVTIQIGLAVLVILVAEAAGTWFLNEKMNIPAARLTAAGWAFHFSVLTFATNLISIPYNACIVAHERMSAFAYISILEAVGKLAVSFMIVASSMDKLILYAVLMCGVSVMVRLVYGAYCGRHFEECACRLVFDRELLKRMFSFTGWNFICSSSGILRDQGVNVIINLFCGPVANAARGIALQVNGAVQGFVSNYMTSMNPQIIKSYASGDKKYLSSLLFRGMRYSFFLFYILSLPVIIEADSILAWWLGSVPGHAGGFTRLILLLALSDAVSSPLITANLATGDIKKYSLLVGGFNLLNFPLSYLFLYWGCPPECTVVIAIVISLGCLIIRFAVMSGKLALSFKQFFNDVLLNITVTGLISCIIPLMLHFGNIPPGCKQVAVISGSLASSLLVIYLFGCTSHERDIIRTKAAVLVRRFGKRMS